MFRQLLLKLNPALSTFPDQYSKISTQSQRSDFSSRSVGALSDLLRAASTGPAFEPPLLVLDGPTAAPNSGAASCLACETLHPAAKAQTEEEAS